MSAIDTPELRVAAAARRRAADAFRDAGRLARAGRLLDAEVTAQMALKADPLHIEAAELLATLVQQRGDLPGALAWCEVALRIAPDRPETLNRRSTLLKALGRYTESLADCDRALSLAPGYARAHNNRAVALQALERHEDALASASTAVALEAANPRAHYNRGVSLEALQRHDEAEAAYARALALEAGFVEAHNNRGVVLRLLGRFEEAVASFDRALTLRPGHAKAHAGRAFSMWNLKRDIDAVEAFSAALKAFGDAPSAVKDVKDMRNGRGVSWLRLERPADALPDFEAAVAADPDNPELLHNRAVALVGLKHFAEALPGFDRALALRPDYADAHNNRGVCLLALLDPQAALESLDRALELRPDYVDALNNRGGACEALRDHVGALESYDRAMNIAPNDHAAAFNKALLLILRGDYVAGWAQYESRWLWHKSSLGARRMRSDEAPWLGDAPLDGKRLLLHAEQGQGDTIQFCRYAPLAAARGAQVTLAVQPTLVELMRGLAGVESVISDAGALPAFDLHCPLMSLPHAFRTDLASVPAKVPYLAVDGVRRAAWRARLGAPGKSRVGLVWSGSIVHTGDRLRSIALARLVPLIEAADCEWHSLQKEVRESDAAALAASSVRTHDDALTDFAETAALIEAMDLVIAVDTSAAHLAGALGKPLWILLPFAPDYRWMLDREDSPWYPTACLYRQDRAGDWDPVIQRVAAELPRFLAAHARAATVVT